MRNATGKTTMADSIAIGAPMVAPSLELPWGEEEASEESRVSDGLAENSVVVVAKESHVLLGAEDGKTCDPHAVVDTADSLEAINDTSLDEAPKVTLLASQEHGKPSGEQQ